MFSIGPRRWGRLSIDVSICSACGCPAEDGVDGYYTRKRRVGAPLPGQCLRGGD